jgi:hypothetical protein
MKKLLIGLFSAADVAVTLLASPAPQAQPQSDLDAFMKQVLASRDDNWKRLQQFILEESERFDVHGPTGAPVWGERREYNWFIRDGFFIRSPISVNGVTISDDERRKAEDDYLRLAHRREPKVLPIKGAGRGAAPPAAADANGGAAAPPQSAPSSPNDVSGLIAERRAPEFIEAAYFLRFKFDQGTYAFVGRENLDGVDVLKIEYYPTNLFSRAQNKQARAAEAAKPSRGQDLDAAVERMMNKVSLVTLWVEPRTHQIVKYTFDNVNFDFLPGAWLVRITDAKASMTMSQPFLKRADAPESTKAVWLPQNVDMLFGAMLAMGGFDVKYRLDFHDYKQATTAGRIIGGGGGSTRQP